MSKQSDVWKYFDLLEDGFAICKLCKQRQKANRTYLLRCHLKNSHNAKTEIWKYFNNIFEAGIAECKLCKQRVKSNHCTNLTQHMEEVHSIIVSDADHGIRMKGRRKANITTCVDLTEIEDTSTNTLDKVLIEDIPAQTSETLSAQVVDNAKNIGDSYVEICESNSEQSNAEQNFERSILNFTDRNRLLDIKMEENVIKSAVWGLMIDEGLAPSLFGSKNMQALIEPICIAISDTKEKKIKIDEAESERVLCLMANHLRNKFRNELESRLLSLKIDLGVEGSAKSFCVRVSFVDEGKVHTRNLGIIELQGYPELTEEHIKQILHKYNIDCDQIIYACLDNTQLKYNAYVENSQYLTEMAKLENYPDINLGNIKFLPYIGTTAHLCLLDIFKNRDIFLPFLNCRNFVRFLSHEPNRFYEIFKQNNLGVPQLDSPWKWGSTYKMLHDLYKARKVLENKIYPKIKLLEDQFTVNNSVWQFIDACCESLTYIQKAITKFYTEEMHFGDFYSQWLKSKLMTEKLSTRLSNNNNKYITIILCQLLKSIDERTRDFLTKDTFQACLYMDPRFHHKLSLQEKCTAIKYLKNLWCRFKIYNPGVADVATESFQEKFRSTNLTDIEDAFLNDFLSQKTPETVSDSYKKIEGLVLQFKPVETNILLFWDAQKSSDLVMFSLSAICFAIPTTQNYSQNLYIPHKDRSNIKLSSATRDNLLILRLNPHLIEKALEQFNLFEEEISTNKLLIQEATEPYIISVG